MLRTATVLPSLVLALLLFTPASAQVTFTDVTLSSGTGLGEGTARGIAWGDFNNDGLADLFLPTSGSTPNKLYRNNTDRVFTEIAAAVNLNDLTNTITCSWADFDNDGDLDLLTTATAGPTRLWRNNRNTGIDTTFLSIETTAGIVMTGAQMPVWADYNRDGLVDFYSSISNSSSSTDALYRNNGNETFTNVVDSAGANHMVSGVLEQGLGWGDYNKDGYPDLFIGNLQSTGPSFFHRNNGNGTFTEMAATLGFAGAARGTQWVDYNNDGLWDFSVAGYAGGTATIPVKLFRNNGDGTFTDVASSVGMSDAVISWGVTWADYDNNGYEDCFVAVSGQSTSCLLYKNNGNGTFTNVATQVGLGSLVQLSAGWADYDNDGNMDLYTAGAASAGNHLFRNNGDSTKKWLEINLVGATSNRVGVGAQIEVYAGSLHMMREVNTGVGYRSQNMLTAHFGLGTNLRADSIVVRWPNQQRTRTVQRNVNANQVITITEQQQIAHILATPDTLTLVSANSYTDTLWVKNTGTAPLLVDSIYTSPNDTLRNRLIISPRRFTTAPGDSQRIVLYEVMGINNLLSYNFTESLFVSSNDPVNPLIHVVLRGDYSPILAVTEEQPERFALLQNSPNPFNPATIIRFSLPNPGQATLRVFDVLGREVSTLVNEIRPAGRHETTWDARNVGSGLYFYRLQTGMFTETRKMLLLK